jgi:hypothetical protein
MSDTYYGGYQTTANTTSDYKPQVSSYTPSGNYSAPGTTTAKVNEHHGSDVTAVTPAQPYNGGYQQTPDLKPAVKGDPTNPLSSNYNPYNNTADLVNDPNKAAPQVTSDSDAEKTAAQYNQLAQAKDSYHDLGLNATGDAAVLTNPNYKGPIGDNTIPKSVSEDVPADPTQDQNKGLRDAVIAALTPEEKAKSLGPADVNTNLAGSYRDYYTQPTGASAGNEVDINNKAAQIASQTQGGAVNAAMQAAMAAGMSPAQAAFAASRAGSNAYQSAFPAEYNALKQMGMNEQEIQNAFATTVGGQQLTKENQANTYALGNTGLGIQEQNVANTYDLGNRGLLNQQSQQTLGGLGGLLGGAASLIGLLSDETMKEDKVKDPAWSMLASVTKEVKPYFFKYNERGKKITGDGDEQVGIMAQDLEKTPLKSSVMDTPDGKMIDTRKLTTGNTAMIMELSKKLDKAMQYMARGK